MLLSCGQHGEVVAVVAVRAWARNCNGCSSYSSCSSDDSYNYSYSYSYNSSAYQ